jgi:ubiquitin C-terminal hydrolase
VFFCRFKYQGVWRDKINTVVDYPIDNLDLGKFILNNDNNKKYKYNLYAISNHTGTLDGGHYTALCKNDKLNHWFKYDDSTVKETDLESIKSASSSYILFYASV